MELLRRNDPLDVISAIPKDINNYSLNALIRILESVLRESDPKILKLRSDIRLNVPWCEISGVDVKDNQISIRCNRFGIASLQSCLPNSYIQDFISSKSMAMREFLDVFNNRLLHVSYQTSKNADIVLQNKKFFDTNYAKVLRALCGDTSAGAPRNVDVSGNVSPTKAGSQDLPKNSIAENYYSALISDSLLFWRKPRTYIGLVALLERFFCRKVKVKTLVGGWRDLDEVSLTLLGKSNIKLGNNTVVGDKIWDQADSIEITLLGVDKDDFQKFVVDNSLLKVLSFIMNKYINSGKRYRVKLRLRDDVMSPASLDGQHTLGINAWLKSSSKYDSEVLVYSGRVKNAEREVLGLRSAG